MRWTDGEMVMYATMGPVSWDLFVMDLPADAGSIDDIPGDFVGASLGSRAALIARMVEVAPGADFSDPSWGRISNSQFSIEVSLGDAQEVDSFAFHVRGDDAAIGVISDILRHLGLRAVDPQSASGFFSPTDAMTSFHAWRAYRDSVID